MRVLLRAFVLVALLVRDVDQSEATCASARMPSPLTTRPGRFSRSTARPVTREQSPRGTSAWRASRRTSTTRPTGNAGWPCWSRSRTGAMPPKEKPRPPAKDVQALTDWISGRVAAAEAARSAAQGRVVLRRLNRVEYENTVRDLLGVDVDLKDLLPRGHVGERLRQQRRGAARLLLPDGAVPGSGRQGPGRGHRQRAAAAADQEALRHQGREVRQTDRQRLPPPGRRRGDLQLVGLGQHPGHAVALPHPRPRQVPLPHLRLRLSNRQAGHLSRDGRHPDGGDRAAPRRLLRRPARQADRGRVRRASGGAEHAFGSSRTDWA